MCNVEIKETEIEGLYIIKYPVFNDLRGSFTKIYNEALFSEYNLSTNFKESFYTISKKDVIRGMHFQKPPYDHDKLVFVPKGKIIDVVLDLRKDSKTYKKFISIELSDINGCSIYIPKGLAHGYKSMQDDTITVYNVTTEYNVSSDSGVKWDSFGMEWGLENPIISNRDKSFVKLCEMEENW